MPPRKRAAPSLEDADLEDMVMPPDQLPKLRTSLLHWYDGNHRVLPWRRTPHSRLSPEAVAAAASAGFRPAPEGLPLDETIYRTWVCEVMSQQTQVARVAEYFGRWVARWPRCADLAAASQEEVNEAWAGLGYYRRARYLLEGARYVAGPCGGTFPRTAAGLRAVPGVGPYTAAAIASTACGEHVPVLDGNVVRVLTRLYARAGDAAALAPRLTAAAGALLDPGRPGDFNQAMMELGATLCVPNTTPNCPTCPLAQHCAAYRLEREHGGGATAGPRVTDYPSKVEKAPKRELAVAVAVVEVRGVPSPDQAAGTPRFLLVKRPEKGLLAGLWQFPLVEVGGEEGAEEREAAVDHLLAGVLAGSGVGRAAAGVTTRRPLGQVVHIFSHIRMTIHAEHMVFATTSESPKDNVLTLEDTDSLPEFKWVTQAEVEAMGLSSSVQKVYKLYKGSTMSLAGLQEPNSCHLLGTVVDCCCSYSAVEQVNRDEISPVLDELVQSAFFRFFKVDLYCECPFWPDDGMCSMRDCSVCECEEDEVPEPWRAAEGRLLTAPPGSASCAGAELESTVDRTIQPGVRQALLSVRDWRGYRNPWMPEADESEVEYAYINLLRNPERYTGYAGDHAARVWSSIYGQPGLEANVSAAPELRVFYRLLSGVHASISAHLAADFLLDEATGTWGPNLAEFQRRLGTPAVRDRVENLYFAYLFVLRAVMKASPILRGLDYNTGMPAEDAATQRAMARLLDNVALQQVCPIPFDEGRLWRGEEGPVLKEQLKSTFQNITRVMDCVGCEKCKLWGKLQFLGLATSLKVLFSAEDCSGGSVQGEGLQLERNEVIALINLLERLSNSVEIVRSLSVQLAGGSAVHPQGLGAIQDVVQHSLPGQLRVGGG